jgi:hypothetical protein
MGLARYKFMVQVVMGEQKGEGIRIGSRFFWDADTDKFASETFVNVRAVMLRRLQCGCGEGAVSHRVHALPAGPHLLRRDGVRRLPVLNAPQLGVVV